jgi:hypothetical protein
MGPWNLTERVISPNTLLVNDEFPLVCYHFSGYEIARPDQLCKYQDRYTFENRMELSQLYKLYSKKLVEHGMSLIPITDTSNSRVWSIANSIKFFKAKIKGFVS